MRGGQRYRMRGGRWAASPVRAPAPFFRAAGETEARTLVADRMRSIRLPKIAARLERPRSRPLIVQARILRRLRNSR